MSTQEFKCTQCTNTFPLTPEFFSRRKDSKTGFLRYCKSCESKKHHEYYLKHRESIISRVAKYKKSRPEWLKAHSHKYYLKHKEQHNESVKRWKQDNVEKSRLYSKRTKEKNPQYARNYLSVWKKKNPDKVKAIWERYRKRNPEKIFERSHAAAIDKQERKKNGITAIGIYLRDRGICHICKKRVAKTHMSLDHIIPKSLGGPGTWENLVLAHLRCNVKRGVDRIPAQYRLF